MTSVTDHIEHEGVAQIVWNHNTDDPYRAHICWLYVEEEYRGQGWGKALVGEVFKRHPILTLIPVTLSQRYGSPEPFYWSLGFRPIMEGVSVWELNGAKDTSDLQKGSDVIASESPSQHGPTRTAISL